MAGSINKRMEVHAGLSPEQNPISKITRAKRDGSVVQALEYLPSKCEALNSNPSTKIKRQTPCS
jgi:hypothetical protein